MRGWLGLVMLGALVLAGCSTKPSSDAPRELPLVDDRFPGDRTVGAGSSLTFSNRGSRDHTVTIEKENHTGEKLLDRLLEPTQIVTFTFGGVGTYRVWCQIHGTPDSGMHMVVTVR
jgi:hypothetical protein